MIHNDFGLKYYLRVSTANQAGYRAMNNKYFKPEKVPKVSLVVLTKCL